MRVNKLLVIFRFRPDSRFWLALALIILGSASAAGAQTEFQKRALNNDGPINIAADRLEASDLEQVLIFAGNVVARQGDLTLTCNWMRVTYSSQTKTGDGSGESRPAGNPLDSEGQAIDRIDCEGAVQISQNDQVAVGDKAIYLAQNTPRRIVLTGNARLWQGRDYLAGHQVTYYLDQGRSVVEGADGQRVRGTYYQEGSQNAPDRSGSADEVRP